MAVTTLQQTMDELFLRIRAGFPLIFLETREELRALKCLAKIVRVIRQQNPSKTFLRWSEDVGLEEMLVDGKGLPAHRDVNTKEPIPWKELDGIPSNAVWKNRGVQIDAIETLKRIRDAGVKGPSLALEDCVAVFVDVHRRISNDDCVSCSDLVRPLRTTYNELRMYYQTHVRETPAKYKTIIIIGPSATRLSSELEGDLSVLTLPLPEKAELEGTLREMTEEEKTLSIPDEPTGHQVEQVLGERGVESEELRRTYPDRLVDLISNAGLGLPHDAFRLGLNGFAVLDSQLRPDHIDTMLMIKSDAVANMPALEYTPHVDVELGGLEDIKEWVQIRLGAVTSDSIRRTYNLPALKGALLCGVAGGGKSQLARYMARAFNLALLRLDVGALFGSYIGESEERTRQALQLAETLAPVVLWIDEIDKAFKGSGDSSDSGTSSRVIGHILTWLAEKQSSTVFVVATANDFTDLLGRFPELSRKGRFDLIYWVDLPDRTARKDIFRIYLEPLTKHHAQPGRPYLEISDEDVSDLASQHDLPKPAGETTLDRFCRLLSEDTFSVNLTGAEIEAAIDDAKFHAFDQDRSRGECDTLTAALLAKTVQEAMNNALYHEESPDRKTLDGLRKQAQARGWMGADPTGEPVDDETSQTPATEETEASTEAVRSAAY